VLNASESPLGAQRASSASGFTARQPSSAGRPAIAGASHDAVQPGGDRRHRSDYGEAERQLVGR
jgi:hypothetical protein